MPRCDRLRKQALALSMAIAAAFAMAHAFGGDEGPVKNPPRTAGSLAFPETMKLPSPEKPSRFPEGQALVPPSPDDEVVVKFDEDAAPIDLATAYALAGVGNPEILVAMQRTTAASARQQLAAVQILPNLNLGTNYDMHLGVLQQASGNILSVNRNSLYLGSGASAVASGTVRVPGIQYNLNVGESIYRYLAERQLTESMIHRQNGVRNQIILATSLAYADLVRAESQRSVAIQSRAESREIAEITAAFAQTGEGRPSDAGRAATELSLREAELMQTEAQVSVASARLAALLNLSTSTRLHALDNWLVPHPAVPEQISRRELLALALVNRPEMLAHRNEVSAALIDLTNAKVLPFSPQLMLGLSSGMFGGGSNLITGAQSVSGSFPNSPRFGNFDGRGDLDVVTYWSLRNLCIGNKALINEAAAHWQEADLELLKTMNRVQREVVAGQVRTHAAFSQINLREQALRTAILARREDLIRIRSNEGLPIEALDSLRLLRLARQEYINTIVDYNKAHFELYTALGNPPADLVSRTIPSELAPPADTED